MWRLSANVITYLIEKLLKMVICLKLSQVYIFHGSESVSLDHLDSDFPFVELGAIHHSDGVGSGLSGRKDHRSIAQRHAFMVNLYLCVKYFSKVFKCLLELLSVNCKRQVAN